MKLLYPLISAFFISCSTEPEDVYGCTVATACNFNPNATIFDDSCEYDELCDNLSYESVHWSLKRWFYDYYKWEDSNNEYHYIFVNGETGSYPNIWEGSHHLNFSVNGNYYSSNSDEFETFYTNNELSDEVMAEIFFENNEIFIEKDHYYYENIGKYNHFFAGWDDNDALYVVVNQGSDYICISPHKNTYREIWSENQ